MRRRKPVEHGYDQGLSLQDLLSNALAAVILLTLIAVAITGTGRELLRQPPERAEPRAAERVEWIPPPEPLEIDTLLLEITLDLDRAIAYPLLAANAVPEPRRTSSSAYRGGQRHVYSQLLPVEGRTGWQITLDEATAVERLGLRIHAGAALVREAEWSGRIPNCRGGTVVLTLCAGRDGIVRADLPMACGAPRRCE